MKKYNKFIIGGVSALSVIATPVALASGCGSLHDSNRNYYDLLPTYTGEADQLIALGIKPDYYPLQLDADKPYDYLVSPEKYLAQQPEAFRNAFGNKVKSMMSNVTQGVSWWNQQAVESGEKGSDPSYWQRQSGGVVLYEHYLLDDDAKIIDSSIAPKHDPLKTIETNFRWSRDPYTRLSKGVIFGLDKVDMNIENGKLVWKWTNEQKPTPWEATINGEKVNVTAEDIEIIQMFIDANVDRTGSIKDDQKSWIYNSKFFAYIFHVMYLDNPDFANSQFANWIVDTTKYNAFDQDQTNNAQLQKLFGASTFRSGEANIKSRTMNSLANNAAGAHDGFNFGSGLGLAHHPIYEQQEGQVGAAPMFEGSMRDNMLYLFNVAYQVSNLANYGNTLGNSEHAKQTENEAAYQKVKDDISKMKQAKDMREALTRSNNISMQLRERLKNMRDYFASLGANGKVFGLVTVAPVSGEHGGSTTIQSMSKYSFLYRELGFKQPLPSNLAELAQNADAQAGTKGSLFNMDDNGWWWNLGVANTDIAANLVPFRNNIDIPVITSRDLQFNAVIKDQQLVRTALAAAIKGAQPDQLDKYKVDYDLWNEGIKTPFVFHMILDDIVARTEAWAKAQPNAPQIDPAKRAKALDWGNYFTQQFIA